MIGLLAMAAAVSGSPSDLAPRQLDAVSAQCATPKRWLIRHNGGVYFRPDSTAPYDKVDCVLHGLTKNYHGHVGFIGNEAYR